MCNQWLSYCYVLGQNLEIEGEHNGGVGGFIAIENHLWWWQTVAM